MDTPATRYAEAARAYEKATELGGSDYRVWRNLGVSYFWAPGEKAKAPDGAEGGLRARLRALLGR